MSQQFNLCLRAIVKLHDHLLHKLRPLSNDYEDEGGNLLTYLSLICSPLTKFRILCANSYTLTFFILKNCLGALDCTDINVRVPSQERGTYRTRKGTICMNVLDVCPPNMQFIYVLPGWKGSIYISMMFTSFVMLILGLMILIPSNHLILINVKCTYYLVDAGYTNCEGFLAPYQGKHYHLKEWRVRQPESEEE